MIIISTPKFKIDKLAFSPDGTGLFAPRPDHSILHWTISDGDAPTLLPTEEAVWSVQFTPDGKSMVLDGWRVYLRDMMTGDRVKANFPPGDYIKVSLTQNRRGFVAASTNYRTYPSSRVVFRSLTHLDANVWSVDVRRSVDSSAMYLPGGTRFVIVEYETGNDGTEPGW